MADFQKLLVDQILKFDDFFGVEEQLGNILSKSSFNSEKFRTEGNTLYVKKKHSKDDHKQILLLYTRSISFAPNYSEDLAKGYSNRSALLLHLQRYEECLIDIDRALEISKSDALRAKLESRKQDCLNLRSNKPITRIFPDKLPDIQSSAKLLSASEAVDVKYNHVLGRHLVATRDVKAGEVIIVEKGCVCFPKKHQIYITCSHCMGFAWNGIPCDTCIYVVFCSETCKQAAWQEYHAEECSIISFMFFDNNDNIKNMVAIRLFIKAVKSEGFESIINETKIADEKRIDIDSMLWNGMLDSNKFRSCYNLVTHLQDNKRQGLDDNFYETMIINLLLRHTSIIPIDIISNERCKIIDDILIQLVNVFTNLINLLGVNSFAYQGNVCDCNNMMDCKKSCDSSRGSMIAPTCSLVNHSCCPNISRMFIPQRKIVMYATASIKKGQQICDSYGPTFTMVLKERQKYLKDHFHFTCKCTACEENWPSDFGIELYKNPRADTEIMKKILKEFKQYFPDETNFFIKTITTLINGRQFDRTTFGKVIRFSQLVYKYFGYREAFYCSLVCSLYIDRFFFQFYGEKYDMKNCQF